jgi:hypothetical protein
MTIYEVMYEFLEFAFPSSIITQFQDHIDVTAFVMTYFVIFGLILMPLWNLATFFLRRAKK